MRFVQMYSKLKPGQIVANSLEYIVRDPSRRTIFRISDISDYTDCLYSLIQAEMLWYQTILITSRDRAAEAPFK